MARAAVAIRSAATRSRCAATPSVATRAVVGVVIHSLISTQSNKIDTHLLQKALITFIDIVG